MSADSVPPQFPKSGKNVAAEKAKLTDTFVREAAGPDDPKKERMIWDTEVTGFGLRIRGNSKSFVLLYRPKVGGVVGPRQRMTIGKPGALPGVKEARRLAQAAMGTVASGADPRQARVEEKKRKEATISKMLDRYDEHLQRREYVARNMVMSLLRTRLAPLMSRDVATVKGWEFAAIVEKLGKDGKPGAASAFRSRCSTFLNWCAFDTRVIEANPLAGYRRGRETRVERVTKAEKGRALSDEELAAVWRAADPESVFGRVVRFLILTGCRRSEGAGMRRSMIDRKAGRIDLPPTFTKQARGHTVYISAPLGELLDLCPQMVKDLDLLFPAVRKGRSGEKSVPISGWSKYMDKSDKRTAKGTKPGSPGLVVASGVQFTLHDLRRTFRTGLSRLGVETDIAELALGHARADLEARYNRDDREAALRDAFDRWGRHVDEITEVESIFD